eukprot:TRINITY_DN20508_c0_g1_i1.p1 TRINITY_DN20508_c0_g1~~TRINITY_DN20508_c0_g1_i1.p1  ORF type:complete len:120 (+),score=4.45 TRINITY_DN20508_c0_g1_i1:165-524(+)
MEEVLDLPDQSWEIVVHLRNLQLSKVYVGRIKGNLTAKLNLVSIRRVTWFLASSMARSCSLFWIFLTNAGLTLSSNSSAGVYKLSILMICDHPQLVTLSYTNYRGLPSLLQRTSLALTS